MENRSLDEFANNEETDGGDSDGRDETRAGETGTTSRWTAGGRPCPDCGASVTRLWGGDDGLTCVDCKDWS